MLLPPAGVAWPREQAERERRVFMGGLLVATLLPLLLMPLLSRFHPESGGVSSVRNLLVFLGGNGHVALTAFFYTDRRLWGFFREHRVRYALVPLGLVLGAGFAWTLGAPVAPHLLLAYLVWQTYHYMRQNQGILAFVASATGTGPTGWLERVTLNLGVSAGILGLVRQMALQQGTVLEGHEALLYQAGLITYLWVPVFAALAILDNRRILRSPARLACLLLCAAFYLPTFLFDDMPSAILGYALAHGLQYFVFMGYAAYQNGSGAATTRLLVLLLICLSLGSAMMLMGDRSVAAEFVFGCYLGLVMAHFVVDAGLWRLSQRFQRDYLRQSFGFVIG
jgi:hypothetical protein